MQDSKLGGDMFKAFIAEIVTLLFDARIIQSEWIQTN